MIGTFYIVISLIRKNRRKKIYEVLVVTRNSCIFFSSYLTIDYVYNRFYSEKRFMGFRKKFMKVSIERFMFADKMFMDLRKKVN